MFKSHIELIIDDIHEDLKDNISREEFLAKCVLKRVEHNTKSVNIEFDKCLERFQSDIYGNQDIGGHEIAKSILALTKILDSVYKNLINEFKFFEKFLD